MTYFYMNPIFWGEFFFYTAIQHVSLFHISLLSVLQECKVKKLHQADFAVHINSIIHAHFLLFTG